jgi:hypothetical protein
MKTPERTFMIEVSKSAIIGIPEGAMVGIALGHGKQYHAEIGKVHSALARWCARERPPEQRRKRRRLFKSSEELRRYRREHPEES